MPSAVKLHMVGVEPIARDLPSFRHLRNSPVRRRAWRFVIFDTTSTLTKPLISHLTCSNQALGTSLSLTLRLAKQVKRAAPRTIPSRSRAGQPSLVRQQRPLDQPTKTPWWPIYCLQVVSTPQRLSRFLEANGERCGTHRTPLMRC
jgi:hypothetical protein